MPLPQKEGSRIVLSLKVDAGSFFYSILDLYLQ